MTYKDRSRDWNDGATNQGMPRIAGIHQKLEEAREDSLVEFLEGA